MSDNPIDGRTVFLRAQLAPVEHVPLTELPSDPAWRTSALRRLEELGVHQYELAAWVGASAAQMTYLLTGRKAPVKGKPTTPTSTRRRRVSEETGEQEIIRSAFIERMSLALRIDTPLTAQLERLALDAMRANDGDRLDWIRATLRLARNPRKP